MEARSILGCLIALAAFGGGASGAVALIERFGHHRRGSFGVQGAARAGAMAWWLRNGVGWARPCARLLLQTSLVACPVHNGAELLVEAGYATTDEALLSSFIAATALGGCVASLVVGSPVCGVTLAILAVAVAVTCVRTAEDRRRAKLRDGVPDALRSMGVCFQAGLTLVQTFQQASTEAKGPIGALFTHAAHLLETGESASRALAVFRARSSVPELSFVAVALDVQHTAGGSLAHVLDAAREAVEGELELKRSLKVKTAQAKLSARVVSLMPFALVALFSLISSDFLAPFFSSVMGLALLALAIGMQAAGIMIVRRMLDVEVGR